ncbi:MAG: hypothetical protein NTW03_18980, partial [Verrucomicrobia bacterium]|nr:hypothetical protein [Verrucomicrobiota bacterium]
MSAPAAALQPLTTAALIEEMTDLAAVAEFPSPAYTCKQFSSYDRASKSPSENWFANNDCGNYLRVEDRAGRKEHVMMDAAGPGAIVRIWSANPAGTLRIYVDGAEQPVVEAPMSELLGGKFPGLPRPIAGEYSKGWNLYFPILYAKQCKVTSDQGGFYYHVNYRTYEAGTPVESFSPKQLQTLGARLEKLALRLATPRGDEKEIGGETVPFEVQLPPGETVRQEFSGSKAFTRALARLSANDSVAALRGILVKITFDG